MNIVIFNWRDLNHPKAGGAEVATHQLAHGLVRRGHRVTLFTSAHARAFGADQCDGYDVIRKGSELTCRFHGLLWLLRNRHRFDVVIDEVNTLPFLSRLVAGNRVVLWMHQLAREVWLAEAPAIIGPAGYLLERIMLRLYRTVPVVTISESSAKSFRQYGLKGPMHVCEIALQPAVEKGEPRIGRIGYVGRLARSKRIDHIIRATAILRRSLDVGLVIVGTGSERELKRLKTTVREYGVEQNVIFAGKASNVERDEWMRSLDVLAMTSMREGWGLVVSEAARYQVPSVVYPVAGLVDSVVNGRTGIVVSNETPAELADAIMQLIRDRDKRDALGRGAGDYLDNFTDERFVGRFERVLFSIAR